MKLIKQFMKAAIIFISMYFITGCAFTYKHGKEKELKEDEELIYKTCNEMRKNWKIFSESLIIDTSHYGHEIYDLGFDYKYEYGHYIKTHRIRFWVTKVYFKDDLVSLKIVPSLSTIRPAGHSIYKEFYDKCDFDFEINEFGTNKYHFFGLNEVLKPIEYPNKNLRIDIKQLPSELSPYRGVMFSHVPSTHRNEKNHLRELFLRINDEKAKQMLFSVNPVKRLHAVLYFSSKSILPDSMIENIIKYLINDDTKIQTIYYDLGNRETLKEILIQYYPESHFLN